MTATPQPAATPALDPDRFFDLGTPGSQEWWYFDAISDDGRDALVVILFAGLPFDPRYSGSALRHLKDPEKHRPPHPLDASAVSLNWYKPLGSDLRRKGRGRPNQRVQAYALEGHGRDAFAHEADPFRVAIAGSRVERGDDGYRIVAEARDFDPSRTIRFDLRFRPAAGTEPFEVDLGGEGSPHRWVLAAADCRVEGTLSIDGPGGEAIDFKGRGYHDHNAGSEELSLAMKRWEWGRVHQDERTDLYYIAEPRKGPKHSLWISCRDGKPEQIRTEFNVEGRQPWADGIGSGHLGSVTLRDGNAQGLSRWTGYPVDSGPFYHRWLSEFRGPGARTNALGFSELLNTRWMNHPLTNWMIPYRLRRGGR